jgi:hypothetical protein
MYYRHDENYVLIEKSTEELQGENVLVCGEDLDLSLYDVIVGYENEAHVILRHTKKLRNVDAVVQRLGSMQEHQVEVEVEVDFRLCMIELGLV